VRSCLSNGSNMFMLYIIVRLLNYLGLCLLCVLKSNLFVKGKMGEPVWYSYEYAMDMVVSFFSCCCQLFIRWMLLCFLLSIDVKYPVVCVYSFGIILLFGRRSPSCEYLLSCLNFLYISPLLLDDWIVNCDYST